jgi:hypothetical protein
MMRTGNTVVKRTMARANVTLQGIKSPKATHVSASKRVYVPVVHTIALTDQEGNNATNNKCP